MSEEIINAERIISSQRKSFDALLSITKPEAGFPTVDRIAQKAIEVVMEITGFRTITFRIYDREKKCVRIIAQHGMSNEMIEKLT